MAELRKAPNTNKYSVETFDCSIKTILQLIAFDCVIRVTCINLIVLIKYFDF